MKNKRVLTHFIFMLLTACFLVCALPGHTQVISATADTVTLDGIRLNELVDYLKGHSFSMEDYLTKRGYNKSNNSREHYFHKDSLQSWVYFPVTGNNYTIPKSITDLKQEYIAIKSKSKQFRSALENIINDLKNDEDFGVEINYRKGEYSFYSIKKDFNIKILSAAEYDLIALY